ncbi:isoleucine--tRNA ligase [Sedimentibacter sp. zth1]|uniref:isoleucine--tRNA ligase n=1 Tax=Sedimentibacter sp. zth1 TaxID=2816908 RepID=UPI001A91CF93|nr:isoleucine--tRNA ligase [Sedimentibacter sp. zth1]QSX04707.1 isoleucine--tRNA ligase [Sedimentibacter sp. zth1]
MKLFKDISKLPYNEYEKEMSNYWENIDLLHQAVETRKDKQQFVFYEGPPTANGRPGIHHVIARTLKDSVCRFKTMEGYQVKRKAGWDTHGLPVEIEVEKKLGLKNKQDIENYGIDKFNENCRESVFTYSGLWRQMTERMAYLIDLDNPYITLDNNYIESVWWILNKFFKEGLMYEGHKILPYCPRCGTGLASHEVAQGYEEIKTATAFVKFKLVGKNEYFLAWTTTPWTLASNVALTVHADMEYVKIKLADTEDKKGDVLYLAKSLLEKVIKVDYEILEEMKGKDLEFVEYEQIMPFVKADKKAFFVTCADYVTAEDGTGIVHTAPAFGEDDYNTGKRYNLPVLQPVDDTGKFTQTPWKGMFVMDADKDILIWLKEQGKLFKKETVFHNYPHCWRCKTPLLYYAKPSWYIQMTKLKDNLVENNKTVEWYPDFVGEKRFGNWLENVNDWAVSRSRYWGTPLPIWRCECGHVDSIGSRKELAERAIENIDENIELHRPFVDDVHITCPHCGKPMTRVKDVIDCWFDSGSMPFAQQHYPFENKENFDEMFPADFICEGIDQTRGWFYSLLAISTFVKGVSPYKRVLVNDLILDKFGKKMSKSKGNGVDPFQLFDKYGADALRWYLLHVSPAWSPTKFDEDGLKEVLSKFFGTIKNVYTFFALYANTDNVDPREFFVEIKDRPELDRWIISKYNNLVKYVKECMDVFDLNKVVRAIQDFINEDLSNWYIRRSRRRFWATELTEDKKSVYVTTYEILVGVSKLVAPFAPYIAEELYRDLTGEKSVHLADYPIANEEVIDLNVEKRMDLVRDLVKLGRASRETTKIKVRQPIQKIYIDGRYEALISDMTPLIMEELNVKEVLFEQNLNQYINFTIKPNFKTCGPKLGKDVKVFAQELLKADTKEIISTVQAGNVYNMAVSGNEIEITEDMLDIRIAAKEGYDVEMSNNLFVIIDTNLTKELIDEGYAREFVSKIQQMRKTNGYEMMDNIKIFFNGNEEISNAVDIFTDFIKSETLAIEITKTDDTSFEVQNLNGIETGIKLEKVN